MAKQEQQPPAFVIAAMLAGHLFRMMRTAKLMSLSASNAKGVAARAGDKALGFRPITDFIAEMANDTIHYATKINQLALTVSRTAVNDLRTLDAAQRFAEARDQITDTEQAAFIDHLIQQANIKRAAINTETAEIMLQLNAQLDEIFQRVRGSTIIVSNSRTEASRAGEFQKYLDSIADSVELAARNIQREISECRKLIESLDTPDDSCRNTSDYRLQTGTS
ncbi:MAG: hypothetical protein L3J88_01560 [Gammaproteobacteria bacterium]|nr:hypothetical protein [Gammaproteobacteria bacterium]MCF6362052.1 hypothetical protein [Gammaproteobacteria bacterium]